MHQTTTIAVQTRSTAEPKPNRRPLVSVVTAAFNEEQNLPVLYECLRSVLEALDVDWEWIVVDDHSIDDTFAALQSLARQDSRIRGIRFSRNFGSHMATVCGLDEARGDCAVVLSGDLQGPPEIMAELLAEWRKGTEAVWAVRRRSKSDEARSAVLTRLYRFLIRRAVGIDETSAGDADCFLTSRRAIDAVRQSHEGNVSIPGLLAWMGFPHVSIRYDRPPRPRRRSRRSLPKRLKLIADAVTAFSYLPIRMMSLLGVVFAVCGFGLAVFTVVERLLGYSAENAGYAMIMTFLLLGFGFVMTFLGILGEYLWRTFDEVRGRPRYVIERAVNLSRVDERPDTLFTPEPPVESKVAQLQMCGSSVGGGD